LCTPFSNYKIDGLQAYRPLMVLSYALDYMVWGTNSFFWHVHNIILFAGVAFASGVFSYYLLDHLCLSQRSVCIGAILATLLMALYPGHIDSVVTIAGRNDLLALLFYLLALCFYVQYKKNGNLLWRWISVSGFTLGLCSKEIAATLPLVLILAELLSVFGSSEENLIQHSIENSEQLKCAPAQAFNRKLASAFRSTTPYWIALFFFTAVRAMILHSLVGGYGRMGFHAMLRQMLGFLDVDTFRRLVLPINEHFLLPQNFVFFLSLLYIVPIFRLIVKCVSSPAITRMVAFIALFGVLNVLPAFQIWHIYPNLVGCRLFIVSSFALAFLLSLVLIPDSKNRIVNVVCMGNAIALVVSWSVVLANNVQPFIRSGQLMQCFRSQLFHLIEELPPDRKLIVTNLPQDYCGAPMLGKAVSLIPNLKPPLTKTDLTNRVIVLENGRFIDLSKGDMGEAVKAEKVFPIYVWSNESATFTTSGAINSK
jgi:hypothetical protein